MLKWIYEAKQKQLIEAAKLPSTLQSRVQVFTDADVLMKASGGLALEGIYLVSNLEELLKKRERLLEIPNSFEFSSPAVDFYEQEKENTSRMEEEIYLKRQEKLGCSSDNSISANFISYAGKLNTDLINSSNSDETNHLHKSESYFSIIKGKIVPLKSYFFYLGDMRLSESALQELKEIDKSDQFNKEAKCRDFFDRFGTHANQGPLHFGGIFLYKASTMGFSSDKTNEVKKTTSIKLNTFLQGKILMYNLASTDTTLSSATGNCDMEHNTEIKYRTDLSIYKRGGPPEANAQQQWIEGLVANTQTWAVIDKGQKLVPIWEIIEKNHKEHFDDLDTMIAYLQEVETSITTLNPISNIERRLILRKIPTWEMSNVEINLLQILSLGILPGTDKNVEDYITNVAKAIASQSSRALVSISSTFYAHFSHESFYLITVRLCYFLAKGY